jgi:hypothetical protein
MTRRRMTAGLLLAAALGTLIAACVSVGIEDCLAATRNAGPFHDASPSQATLLYLSTATATGAATAFAARAGRHLLLVIVLALLAGGLWFLLSELVFLFPDLGHCPVYG